MITKTEASNYLKSNLVRLMEKSGIGVNALGAASNNDPMVISRIRNKGTIPEADKLLRIAEALKTTVDALFKPPPKKRSKKTA